MSEATSITVGGPRPYQVVVGGNVLSSVSTFLPGVERALILHPATLRDAADALSRDLATTIDRVATRAVPDGEAAKDVTVAAACWDECARVGLTRSDAVVGVGGGATTDLAGFVAATWLRGVRVVHVPTTVLGMVDAAIGGKTAVNVPAGKNLVGAFHVPAAVVCDLDLLGSLAEAEVASGLAEAVKVGFIADPEILSIIERRPELATDVGSAELREIIERSIRVKARVVADDLTEQGGREILNYGHTLGHAIERREHYSWRHGDAVSVGMVFAAALSHAAGRLDRAVVERHRGILHLLGLPVGYSADAWPELLDAMRLDKKSRGAMLRFIVLDGLSRPAVLSNPDLSLLERAFAEVAL